MPSGERQISFSASPVPFRSSAMACSQAAVLTGGNSARRLAMASLASWRFDDFKQDSEWIIVARLGMDKEHGSSPRSGPGSCVDDPETTALHGLERLLRTLHSKRHMGHSWTTAVFLHDLLHR